MKGLAALIKLHKRELDALRRQMAPLENQKAQLQLLSVRLDDELAHESRLAAQQVEMSRFFGGFAERIRQRQATIAADIAEIDRRIAQLTERIAEAFAELKKFEVAQENARQRAQEEERRRDAQIMDEVAAQQHRRKQDGQ